jgi:hypothetical protein
MYGGKSANAAENISDAAKTGLGFYSGASKQRAAGENAILSGRLGLERMRGLQDIRQQQMAQNLEGKIGSQIFEQVDKFFICFCFGRVKRTFFHFSNCVKQNLLVQISVFEFRSELDKSSLFFNVVDKWSSFFLHDDVKHHRR